MFDCWLYRWSCLEHVEEQPYSARLLMPACGVCTCMCMNQLDIAVIGSQLFCILHVNVSGLHQNTSVFLFDCAVKCLAYDEQIWAVACTLYSVPPGLP